MADLMNEMPPISENEIISFGAAVFALAIGVYATLDTIQRKRREFINDKEFAEIKPKIIPNLINESRLMLEEQGFSDEEITRLALCAVNLAVLEHKRGLPLFLGITKPVSVTREQIPEILELLKNCKNEEEVQLAIGIIQEILTIVNENIYKGIETTSYTSLLSSSFADRIQENSHQTATRMDN